METRYQVFLSSTYTDLIEERQVAIKAVLELDHMPAGMELFPATDDEAWLLIQDVIDASDYYVLIIGGRYGSTGIDGLGFTEKEYHYAVAQKKPVIALLHGGPGTIARNKTETDPVAWEKLQKFRAHVESKHTCVYWTNRDELKACLIVSLTKTVKRKPAVGWVRANQVPSEATVADVLKLRQRVMELEAQLHTAKVAPPAGAEDLQQGSDYFEADVDYTVKHANDEIWDALGERFTVSVPCTWDQVFAALAPALIQEASSEELTQRLNRFYERRARMQLAKEPELNGLLLSMFVLHRDAVDTCTIQLRALGLIRQSDRKRAVKDTAVYWSLTELGDQRMVQLRAVRRGGGASRLDEAAVREDEPQETDDDDREDA